jgi:hypothetical protein
VRRSIALAAAALALAAAAAPTAQADSIVFERGGNVWLAAPDGSGAHQVTSSGGYSNPSQANDGTIFAVKGNLIHRMSRGGRLLNLAGDSSGSGPLIASAAPGGALVAYHYNNTGSITPGLRTALSHAGRQTSNDELFNIGGWINPSWIGDGMLLMFDGSPTFTGDTLIYTVGGSGTQRWYEDPDLALSGGEIDPSLTRLAATDGAVIRLYRLNAPPPAVNVDSSVCVISDPSGSFFRPTWSPDGRSLAWQDDEGIWAGQFDRETCDGGADLVIPGGTAPDWGPAAPGKALTAKAAKRIRLAALLKGLKVRVKCTCRAVGTLRLGKRRIGRKSKRLTVSGTLKVKPNRAGRARLLAGGKSVRLTVSGAGATVKRKVKIVR